MLCEPPKTLKQARARPRRPKTNASNNILPSDKTQVAASEPAMNGDRDADNSYQEPSVETTHSVREGGQVELICCCFSARARFHRNKGKERRKTGRRGETGSVKSTRGSLGSSLRLGFGLLLPAVSRVAHEVSVRWGVHTVVAFLTLASTFFTAALAWVRSTLASLSRAESGLGIWLCGVKMAAASSS